MEKVIILPIYKQKRSKIMRKTATILFHARQQAHFWHLETKSYAEHKALNEFYDKILELVDQLLETYLGKGKKIDFGKIRMTFNSYSKERMIEYFKKLARYIYRSKKSLGNVDGDLLNIMEEILGLINQTLYMFTLK
jgi:DNA-binding ferritin-like protein